MRVQDRTKTRLNLAWATAHTAISNFDLSVPITGPPTVVAPLSSLEGRVSIQDLRRALPHGCCEGLPCLAPKTGSFQVFVPLLFHFLSLVFAAFLSILFSLLSTSVRVPSLLFSILVAPFFTSFPSFTSNTFHEHIYTFFSTSCTYVLHFMAAMM